MEFEWDENKRRVNLAAHGIDFVAAARIWEAPVIERPSPQTHHNEERFIAVGKLASRVIAVVFTWRGEKRRLISARAARRNEREDYYDAIG
ncbi:MAG TPA: BrnT family toxin [Bryobacteraceae bacterium]|jgi:hypothetical protein